MRKLKTYRVLLSTLRGEWVTVQAENEGEAQTRAVEGYHNGVEESEVIESGVTGDVELIDEEPYSTEQVLDFIRDHCIQWEMIGHPSEGDARIEFHNYENSTKFCDYPYDNRDSLMEGIWFIMDMHYQREEYYAQDAKTQKLYPNADV